MIPGCKVRIGVGLNSDVPLTSCGGDLDNDEIATLRPEKPGHKKTGWSEDHPVRKG